MIARLQVSYKKDCRKKATLLTLFTARGSLEERVKGLDSGADHYMAKPFAFVELSARIRALLRRGIQTNARIRVADLELNTATVDVQINSLRNKIDKGRDVALLRTIRGVGYMLSDHISHN